MGIPLLFVLALTAVVSSTAPSCLHARTSPQVAAKYTLPSLYFVENKGEFEPAVAYYVRTPTGNVTLRKDGIVYELVSRANKRRFSFRVAPVGANEDPQIVVGGKLWTKLSYFVGNDPSKWRSEAPLYSSILYKDLYPGIDLKVDTTGNRLEYDLIVAPAVDPAAIRLAFKDVDRLQIDPVGNLLVHTPVGEVKHRKPFVYQGIEGERHGVEGRFRLNGKTVSFELGDYVKNYALTIDPTVLFSSYVGVEPSETNSILDVAVGNLGYAYLVGVSRDDLERDVLLARFNSYEKIFDQLLLFGGTGDDVARAVAIDSRYDYTAERMVISIYVVGDTTSDDWGEQPQATNVLRGPRDAFLMRLSTDPENKYKINNQRVTFLRGNQADWGYDVAIDTHINQSLFQPRKTFVYVTGKTNSNDLATAGAYKDHFQGGGFDGYIAKIEKSNRQLLYLTYVGGSGYDAGHGIAMDKHGNAYVVGSTTSLPEQSDSEQVSSPEEPPRQWAFIEKLNYGGGNSHYWYVLGGTLGNSNARDITVFNRDEDSRDYVRIVGTTWAADMVSGSGCIENNKYHGNGDGYLLSLVMQDASVEQCAGTHFGGEGPDQALGYSLSYPLRGGGSPASECISGITRTAFTGTFPIGKGGGLDGFVGCNLVGGRTTKALFRIGGSDDEFHVRAQTEQWPGVTKLYIAGTTVSNDFPLYEANHEEDFDYQEGFLIVLDLFD